MTAEELARFLNDLLHDSGVAQAFLRHTTTSGNDSTGEMELFTNEGEIFMIDITKTNP